MKKVLFVVAVLLCFFTLTGYSYAESPIIINEKAFEGMNNTLVELFKLIIFLVIGGVIGYHLGILLRIYIRLALWGAVLYIISLIVLQSLGVLKLETDTLLKIFLVLVPFIKSLIQLEFIPRTIWWGMLFGFVIGFLNIDLKGLYKNATAKEEKKKK